MTTKPDFAPLFIRGVAHFNAREFWEAHEAWEELWLVAESDLEQYLQGLIQLAAAYHHVKRGTFRGAVRLFDAATRRLSAFPDPHCGLARGSAIDAARKHAQWVVQAAPQERLADADYPRLQLADNARDVIPPTISW